MSTETKPILSETSLMRPLVTIQVVHEILPIRDADTIELAKILGWQAVVKKGEFKVGDKCVYFEIDSYLPIQERYEFLKKTSYCKDIYMGEGIKIRTLRLRGCISQGLLMPLSLFSEYNLDNLSIGSDVTELLGVRKMEMPEVEDGLGTMIGTKPHGVPTTSESRVQSFDFLRSALVGLPYYISTKINGTSMTIYHGKGEIGVCGRSYTYKDDGKSILWDYVNARGVRDRLKEYGKNIAIQGELAGPGICKNNLNLKERNLYVFDAYSLDTFEYLSMEELKTICHDLNLTMIPIEESGINFRYTLEELLEKAKGNYDSGKRKEGIVVRPQNTLWYEGQRVSFKVLNNDFLVKEA